MDHIVSSLPGKAAEDPVVEYRSEAQEQPQKQPFPDAKRKLGIALVGLGSYSEHQLAPALSETEYCRLAGVVSGDAQKRQQWMQTHQLDGKNVYSYDNFDDIAANRDID
ncbi:MAG TPA: hypothetical protein VF490_14235, partial [Chryseosolibacter sp.]